MDKIDIKSKHSIKFIAKIGIKSKKASKSMKKSNTIKDDGNPEPGSRTDLAGTVTPSG